MKEIRQIRNHKYICFLTYAKLSDPSGHFLIIREGPEDFFLILEQNSGFFLNDFRILFLASPSLVQNAAHNVTVFIYMFR